MASRKFRDKFKIGDLVAQGIHELLGIIVDNNEQTISISWFEDDLKSEKYT